MGHETTTTETRQMLTDGNQAVTAALQAISWRHAPRATSMNSGSVSELPHIVVPVFNGGDAVECCLDSLLTHTADDQLLHLWDDGSTEPGLQPLLRRYAANHARIRLQLYSRNRGYRHRANQALRQFAGDVVLLNSDTEVMPGWLDALRQIAADERVAVVCPLSDNATLLTLAADHFSKGSEALAEELQQLPSGGWFPIPTAVGFCMLIKRATVEQLGTLDPLYGPGYGEECDYSMRARQRGLEIACAPRSLVLHRGSQSFGSRSAALSHHHQKLLNLRWPHYLEEVRRFSQATPLRRVSEQLHASSADGKPRILHVLHSLESIGGTELFTMDLLRSIADRAHHTLIAPTFPPLEWSDADVWPWDADVRVLRFSPAWVDCSRIVLSFAADFDHPRLDRFFANLLAGGNFELVHFHSMVGLGTLNWPALCDARGVPYIQSIHDFFPICPDYNMLESPLQGERQPCEEMCANPDNRHCQACFPRKLVSWQSEQPPMLYLSEWHRRWQRILDQAACVITPGPMVSELLRGAFSRLEGARISEIAPYLPDADMVPIEPTDCSDRLTVVFLGNFNFHKGAPLFLAAAKQLIKAPISLKVVGPVSDRPIEELKALGISVSGRYEREDLAHHLSGADLVVLPSVYAETYCIALSEAWTLGLPVLVSDRGALGERVKEGRNGFLFPPGDASALAAKLTWLAGEEGRDALRTVREQILTDSPGWADPIQEIQSLYSELARSSRETAEEPAAKSMPPAFDDTLHRWINWPLTMEPNTNWLAAGGLEVLLFDRDALENDIERTIDSLQQHCEPQITLLSRCRNSFDSGPQAEQARCYWLLIEAGHLVTENLGNWLAFAERSTASLVTADYYLRSDQEEHYHPQFGGRIDPFRLYRMLPRVGAILVNKRWLLRSGLVSDDLAEITLRCLAGEGRSAIAHFPHPVFAFADRIWAAQWRDHDKTRSRFGAHLKAFDLRFVRRAVTTLVYDAAVVRSDGYPELTVVVHARRYSELPVKLAAQLRTQRSVKLAGLILVGPPDLRATADQLKLRFVEMEAHCPAAAINRAVASNRRGHILLLADNIQLNANDCLCRMAAILGWHGIVAVSPELGVQPRSDSVVGAQPGAGTNGSIGRGTVRDQRFDWLGLPLATDLLEEDAVLITRGAWESAGGLRSRCQHYLPMAALALALRETKLEMALLPVSDLKSEGLPSAPVVPHPLEQLAQETAYLRRRFGARLGEGVYRSTHLLPGNPPQLDLNFGAFKTPARRPRVLAYPHDQWASGFYRVRAPLTALTSAGSIACHLMPDQRARVVAGVSDIRRQRISTLLLHSYLHDQQLESLPRYREALDIPMVLSLDDLLTEIPVSNPFSQTVYRNVGERIRSALRFCDRLIVTTDALAGAYRSWSSDVRVIPNYLPADIWLGRRPEARRQSEGKLRVGWFGAPQHAGDLALLDGVIAATTDRYQWVFFGMRPPQIAHDRYEYHPMVPLAMFPQHLAALELDIGVAPLADHQFNRAKSNLKLLEYGVLGVPVVASRVGEYADSGATLVDNGGDAWGEALEELAEDQGLRHDRAERIYHWVRESYILEDHLDAWRSALEVE